MYKALLRVTTSSSSIHALLNVVNLEVKDALKEPVYKRGLETNF